MISFVENISIINHLFGYDHLHFHKSLYYRLSHTFLKRVLEIIKDGPAKHFIIFEKYKIINRKTNLKLDSSQQFSLF